MSEHTSKTIDVRGCHVEVMRGGAGPPLLFLHGAGGAAEWAPFMDRLAERFEVTVPSHPGFGRSDTPNWLDSMSDLAFFYLDLLEVLDLDEIHVVGNSLGGWLACEIAVRNIRAFRTLTLVSPAGIEIPGVPKGDIFLWKPDERVHNTFFDQALAKKRLAVVPSEEAANIALKNLFTTSKLAWSPRFCNPDLAKWLHRITVPTMILWGAEDKIIPAPYAKAFQDLIPGSQLRVIDDCGHLPHQEKMDAFLDGVFAISESNDS